MRTMPIVEDYELTPAEIVTNTIRGKVYFFGGFYLTIILDEKGTKVDLIYSHKTIKNIKEIDFSDKKSYQFFNLDNWQMSKLLFYRGKKPSKKEVIAERKKAKLKDGICLIEEIRIKCILDAYKEAFKTYNKELDVENYTIETLGGLGIVICKGVKLSNKLGKTLKFFYTRKPYYIHISRKTGSVYFSLVFSKEFKKDIWRLDCVKPKMQATETFIKKLAGFGFDTECLKIEVLDIDMTR